jgi:hypothetical protein
MPETPEDILSDAIAQQERDRLKAVAKREKLDRRRQPYTAYYGTDSATGQVRVKPLGAKGVLRVQGLSNVQPSMGQYGRGFGVGFDAGIVRKPETEVRRQLIDTIAQVYFVLEGAYVVAYFVGDKTSLKEIHRSDSADFLLAEAQLRFDRRSKPDITLIYFYPLKRRLVWIRGGTISDTEISSVTLTQAKVLAYGVYGPPTAIFLVHTRRLTRSRSTAPPIIPPTYRLQPYIIGAESQALPSDALASRPALNPLALRPDVDFTLTFENAPNAPPDSSPPNSTIHSFTTQFEGTQRYALTNFTDAGDVETRTGTTDYTGSFATPEFYVDGNGIIQPNAPSNFVGFTFSVGETIDFPLVPTFAASSSQFAFGSLIVDSDVLHGAGVATDIWANKGYLNGRSEFLALRWGHPNSTGFGPNNVALCLDLGSSGVTITPLNLTGSSFIFLYVFYFPNFYTDRTLWYYSQKADKTWEEVKTIVSETGDLTVTTRSLNIPTLKQEPPTFALYKSDYAVNPYRLGG